MKYLMLIMVMFFMPSTVIAKNHFEKDIFQRLEAAKSSLIKNNSTLQARGMFTEFNLHGVSVITGRAVFLTTSGDKILMTIPRNKWADINFKLTKIEYIKSNGYNINIDLPIELVSVVN